MYGVCVCVCVCGGGGGEFVPPTIQTPVIFHVFEDLYLREFSTNHFQTRQFY